MNIKRSYTGSVINTNNLDISKEQQQPKESIIELLNSSTDSNNKLLIQWSNTFVDQQQPHLVKGGKSINHTKLIDYFSMIPDYGSSQDSGGLLTQVCQTHNLRDINNDEPDVKKAKTCSNEKSTKVKNKINLNNLLNDINEFNRLFTNEQQKTVQNEQEQQTNEQSSPTLEDTKKLNDFDQLKLNDNQPQVDYSSLQSPFLTNKHLNNKQQRTSTPRATSKSLFNTKANQENNKSLKKTEVTTPPPPPLKQQQQQQPSTISDDSLVIALSQFESEPITNNQENDVAAAIEKANTVQQQQLSKPVNTHNQLKQQPQEDLSIKRKKFQFNRHNNSNSNNDKSFSRFKSDPLNTSTKIQSDNNKNQQIISSSQSNTTKYDEDDDDDVNLLLNDQNLLKIIDSKKNNQQQQINDTFERNRVVKKAPSLPQLTNSLNSNKLIQVPSSKVGLKIQRLTSSDSLTNNNQQQQPQPNKQLNNLTNKNFYGNNNNNKNNQPTVDHNSNNTSTTSQSTTSSSHKYTNEQIEFKRQQALLRLKNKAK